jgi:galactitol-specific phosphotransferase system IIC component
MPTNTQYLFLVVLVFAVCLSGNEVLAFGAGNIPSHVFVDMQERRLV